jgi:hypothetical protein
MGLKSLGYCWQMADAWMSVPFAMITTKPFLLPMVSNDWQTG